MASALMNTYKRLEINFTNGEGVFLVDDSGRRYLDAIAGIGVNSLGHGHPAVTEAVTRQVGRLIHTSNLYQVALQEELAAMGIDSPTARDVSDAVIRVRRRKLPDPAKIGNAGSFFKNPELSAAEAERLEKRWPALPLHPAGNGRFKASAAWMIEACGWKGRREGDAGVSSQHALVLVNHGAATGMDLRDLARRIQADVERTFGVRLEPEPRLIDLTPAITP